MIKIFALLMLLCNSAFAIQDIRIENDRNLMVLGKIETLDFSQTVPNLEHITFWYRYSYWREELNPFEGIDHDMGLSNNPNLKSMMVFIDPYEKILQLAYLENLESLTLAMGNSPVNFVEHFPNLKTVVFQHHELSFENLVNLAKLPKLDNLKFSNSFYELSDRFLEQFAQLQNLKTLTISHSSSFEDSLYLKNQLQAILPNTNISVNLWYQLQD